VLETQRCHFVGYVGSNYGSGSNEAENNTKPTLVALNLVSEDSNGERMSEEHYVAAMREYEVVLAFEKLAVQPPAI
jgi:hypothetical protein